MAECIVNGKRNLLLLFRHTCESLLIKPTPMNVIHADFNEELRHDKNII